MVLLLLTVLLGTINALPMLNIGVISSQTGIFNVYGQTMPVIAAGWRDFIISSAYSHSRTYIPQLHYCDAGSDPIITANCTNQMINLGAQIIIAPESYLTTVTAQIASAYNIPVIAPTAGTSAGIFIDTTVQGNRLFPNLFGLMSPASTYFNVLLPLLFTLGQRSVGFISATIVPDNEVCTGAILLAQELQYTVYAWTFNNQSQLIQAISQLQEVQPDLVVVCNRLGCDTTLDLLATGYSPKSLAMFECANYISSLEASVGQNSKYIITPLQFDARLRGSEFSDTLYSTNMFPATNNNTSAKQFITWLSGLTNLSLNSLVAPQLAALYTIDYVARQCNCTNAVGLLAQLPLTQFTSFYGRCQFDITGQNTAREMTLIQVDQNYQEQIISPLTSITSSPIVPMPGWTERLYLADNFDTATELGVLGGVVVAIMFGLVIIGFIIIYRESAHIRGTSYIFLIVSVIGWIIILLASLTWTLDDGVVDCQLRLLGFVIGLEVMLCFWVAKTIRIYLIFANDNMNVKVIKDYHVAGIGLVLMLPGLLLMILVYTLDPLIITEVIIDPLRPAWNFHRCTCGSIGNLLINLLLGYFGLLLLTTVVLAYRIKDVESRFNDSKAIAFSIYNIILWFFIIVIIQVTGSTGKSTFLVRSIGIQLSFILTIIVFVFRVYQHRQELVRQPSSSGPKTRYSPAVETPGTITREPRKFVPSTGSTTHK